MIRFLLALGFAFWATGANAQTQCIVPAGAPATPVVSAASAQGLVIKSSPGCLISTYVTIGSTAGYLIVLNATSIPSAGTVTPVECVQVAANTTQYLNWAPLPPEWFSAGVVALFSSTGCGTYTVVPGSFFHGLVQ